MKSFEDRINYIKSKIKIEDFIRERRNQDFFTEDGDYLKSRCLLECNKLFEGKRDFFVSPSRQIFYCFNCHIGGDIISLLCLWDRIDQHKALERLEKHHWKRLVYELKNKLANKEPHEETLKELQAIQETLIENNCI